MDNNAIHCIAFHLIGVGANSLVAGGAGVTARRNGALTPVQRVDGPLHWRFTGPAEGRHTTVIQPLAYGCSPRDNPSNPIT